MRTGCRGVAAVVRDGQGLPGGGQGAGSAVPACSCLAGRGGAGCCCLGTYAAVLHRAEVVTSWGAARVLGLAVMGSVCMRVFERICKIMHQGGVGSGIPPCDWQWCDPRGAWSSAPPCDWHGLYHRATGVVTRVVHGVPCHCATGRTGVCLRAPSRTWTPRSAPSTLCCEATDRPASHDAKGML